MAGGGGGRNSIFAWVSLLEKRPPLEELYTDPSSFQERTCYRPPFPYRRFLSVGQMTNKSQQKPVCFVFVFFFEDILNRTK